MVQDLAHALGKVKVGAQNSSWEDKGAFTGELSPASLKDLGADFTIIGHSERRIIFKESHETLNKKTMKALENDLTVIFCVGETLEEREADQTFDIVKSQVLEGLSGLKDHPKVSGDFGL